MVLIDEKPGAIFSPCFIIYDHRSFCFIQNNVSTPGE